MAITGNVFPHFVNYHQRFQSNSIFIFVVREEVKGRCVLSQGSAEGGVSPPGLDSWVVQSQKKLRCLHSMLSNFLPWNEQSAPLPPGTMGVSPGSGSDWQGHGGVILPYFSVYNLVRFFHVHPILRISGRPLGRSHTFPGCRCAKDSAALWLELLCGDAATVKRRPCGLQISANRRYGAFTYRRQSPRIVSQP